MLLLPLVTRLRRLSGDLLTNTVDIVMNWAVFDKHFLSSCSELLLEVKCVRVYVRARLSGQLEMEQSL